jgi:hypothetical protein
MLRLDVVCASLALVVVLPVPFTPTMETTVGPFGAFSKSALLLERLFSISARATPR